MCTTGTKRHYMVLVTMYDALYSERCEFYDIRYATTEKRALAASLRVYRARYRHYTEYTVQIAQ